MITMIFSLLMLMVFGKLFIWGLRATWGITKMLCTVVLLPLVLIGLVVSGLMLIAFPVLLILGAAALFGLRS